ncbi:hypothetical protein AT728_30670 [Streptomyces silvensis]|uniref:Uncharacterized protein n=2 Tax=Streptomyces silvensis TaxID=1765722 RepID=A0A0W7X9C6_9ACTN|nr:hypothetical protein AT728_30670 [Streptomyces silvensis]
MLTPGGGPKASPEAELITMRVPHSCASRTPAAWESQAPDFAARVKEVAELLRQLRLVYEPVRVRVHATAQALSTTAGPGPEPAFVETVLAYFPTGELRADEGDEQHPWRTSGTEMLDHLYRALDGELDQELASLVTETLALHRKRWLAVCRSYAALQLLRWGAGG